MMVFSGLHKVLMVFSSWRSLIVRDQSLTIRRPWSPGRQSYKLEGSAKICHRMVGDWLPMGGNLCVMVSDSRTISTDLLLIDCGKPVVRPVLD